MNTEKHISRTTLRPCHPKPLVRNKPRAEKLSVHQASAIKTTGLININPVTSVRDRLYTERFHCMLLYQTSYISSAFYYWHL